MFRRIASIIHNLQSHLINSHLFLCFLQPPHVASLRGWAIDERRGEWPTRSKSWRWWSSWIWRSCRWRSWRWKLYRSWRSCDKKAPCKACKGSKSWTGEISTQSECKAWCQKIAGSRKSKGSTKAKGKGSTESKGSTEKHRRYEEASKAKGKEQREE